MGIILLVFAALTATGSLVTVASVGKYRGRITPRMAVLNVAIAAAYAVVLVLAALRLGI